MAFQVPIARQAVHRFGLFRQGGLIPQVKKNRSVAYVLTDSDEDHKLAGFFRPLCVPVNYAQLGVDGLL